VQTIGNFTSTSLTDGTSRELFVRVIKSLRCPWPRARDVIRRTIEKIAEKWRHFAVIALARPKSRMEKRLGLHLRTERKREGPPYGLISRLSISSLLPRLREVPRTMTGEGESFLTAVPVLLAVLSPSPFSRTPCSRLSAMSALPLLPFSRLANACLFSPSSLCKACSPASQRFRCWIGRTEDSFGPLQFIRLARVLALPPLIPTMLHPSTHRPLSCEQYEWSDPSPSLEHGRGK
jgi:hypothetical protein